jgi:phosphatidylglycerophosphatase A
MQASDDKEEVFWDEFLGVLTWTALGWEKVVIVR